MNDDQFDVDIDTDVNVSSVIEQVPAQKESTDCERLVRRSNRQNKGVPVERLSYMVHINSKTKPESWKDMEKFLILKSRSN